MERNLRQLGLIGNITSKRVTIIGIGAVGRQIAFQLAVMGVKEIIVYDNDIIEPHNLAIQCWKTKHLGKYKVYALEEDIIEYYEPEESPVKIIANPVNFTEKSELNEYSDIVISCVDSMAARKVIYEKYIQHRRKNLYILTVNEDEERNENVGLFIDTRMLGNTYTLICIKSANDDWYKTYYEDNAAERGSCTTRSTTYCSMFIASLAIAKMAKYALGEKCVINQFIHGDIGFSIQEKENDLQNL